jgi:asparagine synthase (glutamine-hydrolysing)
LSTPYSLRDSHYLALTHPILPYYLESHDKAAAALGVEHRHPYFDVPLMEFCLALPSEQRLYAGWDRVIQRRAFEGLVPEPIRARQSKSVWTANFARQLLDDPDQRIRGLLESSRSPLAPYCDLGRLRRDVARLRAGQVRERLVEVWCAISLGCWLERTPVTV